jgi:hypothetical protein
VTAPKVRGGKVQKKNNHRLTLKRGYVITRASPKRGYRHVVSKQDLLDFLELIPGVEGLLANIECIHLGGGRPGADGMYIGYFREKSGVIRIEAWPKDLAFDLAADYFDAHRMIFERIHLKFEKKGDVVHCWFDEAKARAFLLVHVFLHELGHHHDFTLRNETSSGEAFAERFSRDLEELVWPAYVRKFGQP